MDFKRAELLIDDELKKARPDARVLKIMLRAIAYSSMVAECQRWTTVTMALHAADDAHGTGFYQDDGWLAAYNELRRMAGVDGPNAQLTGPAGPHGDEHE